MFLDSLETILAEYERHLAQARSGSQLEVAAGMGPALCKTNPCASYMPWPGNLASQHSQTMVYLAGSANCFHLLARSSLTLMSISPTFMTLLASQWCGAQVHLTDGCPTTS